MSLPAQLSGPTDRGGWPGPHLQTLTLTEGYALCGPRVLSPPFCTPEIAHLRLPSVQRGSGWGWGFPALLCVHGFSTTEKTDLGQFGSGLLPLVLYALLRQYRGSRTPARAFNSEDCAQVLLYV